MRKFILSLFCIMPASFCFGQYWQQKVDYSIRVLFHPDSKTLDAEETMVYTNNSPDTLSYIFVHLWPNAYKNDRTAFSEQLLQTRNTSFYFSEDAKRGYINNLDFKSGGISLKTEADPEHIDFIKIILNNPLAHGDKIEIQTPFHVQLPKLFSRSGYKNNIFQVTQWFPKAALYNAQGWHPLPYLENGEYFDDFGKYVVSITAPSAYIIAATGNLKESNVNDSLTTYTYEEENIHDFAWFASKDFLIEENTVRIEDREINIAHYFTIKDSSLWRGSTEFTKRSVQEKSKLLGAYPYQTVKVVASPDTGAGMEYPTVTTLNSSTKKDLDLLINHEVGHNWFQGILATNERDEPWMDEGMNSYYDLEYEKKYYRDTIIKNGMIAKLEKSLSTTEWLNRTLYNLYIDQPINTKSEDLNVINYNQIAYEKASQWLALLRDSVGQEHFNKIMKAYFDNWKFKHPSQKDFREIAEKETGKNLQSIFNLLSAKGALQQDKTRVRFIPFLSFDQRKKTNYINILPALGYNFYDKFMVGGIVGNYNLPPSPLQFLVAPMYATGSKSLVGLGRISYTIFPFKDARQIILSGSFSHFTADQFIDSTGKKNQQPFTKFTPSVKYVFGNTNPLNFVKKWVQFKSYNITETQLNFKRDTVQNVFVISYPKQSFTINELSLGISNQRVLYPYDGLLKAEQGKDFYRISFTGNYYFNYAKGGGAAIRFFAGKFLYSGDQTFSKSIATDRYHLNLTGPKGYEDYTYSNYFFGRNEFEGLGNRQIMIRDGAFKVKTDLLSSKVGKTDNWLGAFNFITTIPKNINPLSILPVKIPLKIFADVGTYAEAWDKKNNSSRFLFDAGLQLSFLKEAIIIYFPLIYSKVYTEYFKSTIPGNRFKNNISFSINFENLELSKLFPLLKL